VSNGEFDVTVIGTGPGGYVAAIRAAQMGLRVASVERDPAGLGGTCLLRGCIPTKALLHTADLYEEFKHAKDYGIVAENVALDFNAVMSRKTRIVNRLSKGIESYLFKKNKITLFKGQARLEGPGNVIVKGESGETKIKTKNVLLATGSRPRTLPGLALDGKAIISSDEILQIPTIPRSLVVIGAGAVGMEFASVFARFGSAVTVIELLPRVLPLEDEEISNEAGKLLTKQVEKGRMTPAKMSETLGRIRPTLNFGDFGAVDIIIEAVVENPKVKQAVLAEVESLVREDTIIASNTSTISISLLAQGLKRPLR